MKNLLMVLLLLITLAGCVNNENSTNVIEKNTVVKNEEENLNNTPPEFPDNTLKWALYLHKQDAKYDCEFEIVNLVNDTLNSKTINDEINNNFLSYANKYLESPDLQLNIISSYKITDSIISIKINQQETNYGTDGEVYTANYDFINDEILTIEFALNIVGLKREELDKMVTDEYQNGNMKSIKILGFFIDKDENVVFVIEAFEQPENNEPWKHLYYFKVNT